MTRHSDDEARQREAQAILSRVRQETEPQIGGATEKMLLGARRHFGAGDADPNDRVEVLGTRIGRIAGLIAFVVLAFLLIRQFAAG